METAESFGSGTVISPSTVPEPPSFHYFHFAVAIAADGAVVGQSCAGLNGQGRVSKFQFLPTGNGQ